MDERQKKDKLISFPPLKQSPRAWFGKFSHAVEKFGLHKSKSDNSIFYRNSSSGIILLVVYVDDIFIDST